jgi:hypothetical protein
MYFETDEYLKILIWHAFYVKKITPFKGHKMSLLHIQISSDFGKKKKVDHVKVFLKKL